MKYVVAVSNYWIGKVKHRRGDIVEMSEVEFGRHGTKLQPYVEPPKAKRKSRAKTAKVSGDPCMDNQEKVSGDPCMDNQASGVENEKI